MANRTKIDWCDYSINPVKGLCPNAECPCFDACYARRMYKRFKWNPEIRLEMTAFDGLPGKAGRVFVGSTIELFGPWVPPEWLRQIFRQAEMRPELTFIFLTKRPERLKEFSPFPPNCFIGVSCANDVDFTNKAWTYLKDVRATVKFISFEPLLRWDMSDADIEFTLRSAGISWIIIGQQTPMSARTAPKLAWVQRILVGASNAGNVPVFMKNNLEPLLIGAWAGWKLRQEFPRIARPTVCETIK